jgi:guanylate kinase
MRPIIGLVGPSGSGKSTLIKEMMSRFGEKLGIVKSLTTRPKRDEDDRLFYHFVSENELYKREEEGRLVQISEYAGNYYAHDSEEILELLQKKIGICALVEQGVKNLEEAGFNVITVKVIPKDNPLADPARQKADEERTKIEMDFDFEIVNDFAPGGLQTGVDELAGIVELIEMSG